MISALTSLLLGASIAIAQQLSVPREAASAIAAANAAWLEAMKTRDAAAIVEPYSTSAVFVTSTGEVAQGREAILRMMKARFAKGDRVVRGNIVQDGVTRQGKLIYEWGHATLELAAPAGQGALRSGGRYLTVWQETAPGRWEIVRNLSLPE